MKTRLLYVLLTALLLLSACAPAAPAPATQPSASPTLPLPTEPAATAPASTSLPPAPEPTSPPPPADTPNLSLLRERRPEIGELADYLSDLNGQYANPEWSGVPFMEMNPNAYIIFKDVDGDGEADLILGNITEMNVMLWQGDHYSLPYHLGTDSGDSASGSKITLEDWTGDNIPDVIFDHTTTAGGTGEYFMAWSRDIIHCANGACSLAWSGQTGAVYLNQVDQGAAYARTAIQQQSGGTGFILRSDKWSVGTTPYLFDSFDPAGVDPQAFLTGIYVFTSTLTTYDWDGQAFNVVETEALRPARWVNPKQVLSYEKGGHQAAIEVVPAQSMSPLDECQLMLNGDALGDLFTCKGAFTRLDWRQVIDDERLELIVTTVSGTSDMQDTCLGSRLFVYTVSKDGSTELVADEQACVMEPDLAGIRIQDTDGDGQSELLVANEDWYAVEECPWKTEDKGSLCWYELLPVHVNVLRWDGGAFVLDE